VVSDDDVLVRDLGSSNGTFVNRRKISQATISPGDLVCMGELVFAVRINGNPAEIDAEEAYDEGHVAAPTAAAASMKPAQARPHTPKAPAAPSSRLVDSDGSSVGDFDFLSEDDDMKKQPKL
jgi:pSer/pThr/pTyr-binding forkhead associated (FHA) protein